LQTLQDRPIALAPAQAQYLAPAQKPSFNKLM
jgi:hypothetical protein